MRRFEPSAEELKQWGLEPSEPQGLELVRISAVLGLIIGLLLDPLVTFGPVGAYAGILVALAGLAAIGWSRLKDGTVPWAPRAIIALSTSLTIYSVFAFSMVFAGTGGILASIWYWLGLGAVAGAIWSWWPIMFGIGIIGGAGWAARRHSIRILCLMRYPLYAAIPAVALALYMAPPPTLETVASPYGRINTEQGPQVVDLVRHQKQVQLFTEALPLFPTGSRYIYVAAAGHNFWQIDSAQQEAIARKHDGQIKTASWRRFQGSLGIALIIGLFAATSYLRRLDRDRIHWAKAVAHDSFAGFRSFIKPIEPKRTGYFLSLGARELMNRKREFALYLRILTYWNRDAPLRDWLIDTVRDAQSPDGVHLAIRFQSSYETGSFRDAVRQAIAYFESMRDQEEKIEDLRRRLAYRNIHQIDQYINQEMLRFLEEVIKQVLAGVFAATLGERIVAFGSPDELHDSLLDIDYRIAQTIGLSCADHSAAVPELDRTWYRGVRFQWSVATSGTDVVPASAEFQTDPSSEFNAVTTSPSTVFRAMAETTFARFGAELMNSMGFPSSRGDPSRSEDEIIGMIKSLMQKIRSETRDQLTDQFIHDFVIEHEVEIRAITEFVASKLDGFVSTMIEEGVEAVLRSIVGQGVAGTIELF